MSRNKDISAAARHVKNPAYDSRWARLKSSPKRLVAVIVAALVLIAAVGAGGYAAWVHNLDARHAERMAKHAIPTVTAAKTDAEKSSKPIIDFQKLREENPDIYAWLYVPGTGINMPLVQNTGKSDDYYLNHDYTGKYSPLGTAYSETVNSMSFTDPVTVIYGHAVRSVFKNLHDFEDADFFNTHRKMYIYLPTGHMLTYDIVAADRTDDSYIPTKYDYSVASQRAAYHDEIMNPPDREHSNVREGVTIDDDAKLLQLSTCMLNDVFNVHRYIITGVLSDDTMQQGDPDPDEATQEKDAAGDELSSEQTNGTTEQ